MKSTLNIFLAFLMLALCTATAYAGIEQDFDKIKSNLKKHELDYQEPSCRGVQVTAFKNNSAILMIEYDLGMSQRRVIRNFYYKDKMLRLVVQKTWFLLDNEGNPLKQPRSETTSKFYFQNKKLINTEGDKPVIESGEKILLEQSARFLSLAEKK